MISGSWVDETSGKIYADKPDTMEDGHKYVQKDIEIVVKVTDIIKNNNLDYEVKTENDNSQLLTGIKLDTDAAQIKKNFVQIQQSKIQRAITLLIQLRWQQAIFIEVIQNDVVVDSVTVVIKGDTD